MNTLWKMCLTAIVGACVAGSAHGQVNDREIKFLSLNSSPHPQVIGMERFSEIVAEKSGGKMKVRLFTGGALGGDIQVISALKTGVVEMSMMTVGVLAGESPAFNIFDLPFLFESGEEADAVLDGPFGAQIAEKLASYNLASLGYWELGFRHLTNSRRPVLSVDDIRGLKIRVAQQPIPLALFNQFGANAVPMPFTELHSALESGAIDGQENPATTILASHLHEAQKYMTLTRHQYNPQFVLVSKSFWDGLSQEEQEILAEAAQDAGKFQRELSREAESKAVAAIRESGVEVSELAPQEVEKLRSAAVPVIQQFRAEIGEDLVDALLAELERVRGN